MLDLSKTQRIINQCPIKVFSASGGGQSSRYQYAYKLEGVPNSSEAVQDTCTEYLLDSGISDLSVTNSEVLDMAAERNATYVIPKDYLRDQERTTETPFASKNATGVPSRMRP